MHSHHYCKKAVTSCVKAKFKLRNLSFCPLEKLDIGCTCLVALSIWGKPHLQAPLLLQGTRIQGCIFISCGMCYIICCFEEEKCFTEMSMCCFLLPDFFPKIHMLCKPLAHLLYLWRVISSSLLTSPQPHTSLHPPPRSVLTVPQRYQCQAPGQAEPAGRGRKL